MCHLSLVLAATCATLLPLVVSFTVPSVQSVDSDITLLYNNDLDLYTAPEHRSVLLLSAQSNSDAETACADLGETLLSVHETFFFTDLPPLLQYEVYAGVYGELQLYWVGASTGGCQAVDSSGQVISTSCEDVLPALCSQSAAFQGAPEPSNSLTVTSNDLSITGYRDQLSFRFLGIPYADPPTRFKYPTVYTGTSVINATAFGAVCVQAGVPESSEDCLFLNIWTPYIPVNSSASSAILKPVLFWIHGGAFTSGTGADPTSDGGNMASRGDVVVVTINYRLSTLGFLALADGETNGNFGIADQIAALDWVWAHIVDFGGDPEHISIMGGSAGAASVRALLASPLAIGKYTGAIAMSNLAGEDYASTYSFYYTIPEEVEVAVIPILEEIGCNITDALVCLTTYNAYDLVNLANVARYVVQDGTYVVYPELPLNGSGTVAKVHTLMGYMRDDGAAFIGYPTNTNLTEALAAQYLPTTVVNNSLFIPPTGPNATLDVFNVTARVATDLEFRCLDQATAWSAVNHDLFENIWFYQFNRSYQGTGFSPNYPACIAPISPEYPYGNPEEEYFKCHSGELYFVFASLPSSLPYRDSLDLPFMQIALDMWTAFARTYDPNPDPLYLATRGYWASLEQLTEVGPWLPVTKETIGTAPLRTLQWGGFQGAFAEQPQCEFLGYPLDYFG